MLYFRKILLNELENIVTSESRFFSLSLGLLYTIFLIAVSLWCSLIISAPLLASSEHKLSSGLIYLFFSKICHQIPERSFFIFGKQLAVCSRCTGLYFGFLLGTILYPFIFNLNRIWIPSRKYLLLALIPITIDVAIRTFDIAENTFASRFVTGLILGTMTAVLVVSGILSIKLSVIPRQIMQWADSPERIFKPD
jgi:uncharacterized membrane protein